MKLTDLFEASFLRFNIDDFKNEDTTKKAMQRFLSYGGFSESQYKISSINDDYGKIAIGVFFNLEDGRNYVSFIFVLRNKIITIRTSLGRYMQFPLDDLHSIRKILAFIKQDNKDYIETLPFIKDVYEYFGNVLNKNKSLFDNDRENPVTHERYSLDVITSFRYNGLYTLITVGTRVRRSVNILEQPKIVLHFDRADADPIRYTIKTLDDVKKIMKDLFYEMSDGELEA